MVPELNKVGKHLSNPIVFPFQMRREIAQGKIEPQARVEIQSFKSSEGFKMPQTMPHTPGKT